jgi:hypothetical protein
MFGMLDYRAHKLFWLIGLPLRIASRLLFFIIIAIAILIGHGTGYHVLVQIVIAYLAAEGMLAVLALLWALLIMKPLEKVFFWIVDVIPSRGENMEEAKLIVRAGPIVWLSKKFGNDIENWTIEDTEEFAKCVNWRARLLFHAEERVWKRATVLRDAYWNTGKQPEQLGQAEVDKLLKPYKNNRLEDIIIHPQGWNAIVTGAIIIAAILYLSSVK